MDVKSCNVCGLCCVLVVINFLLEMKAYSLGLRDIDEVNQNLNMEESFIFITRSEMVGGDYTRTTHEVFSTCDEMSYLSGCKALFFILDLLLLL